VGAEQINVYSLPQANATQQIFETRLGVQTVGSRINIREGGKYGPVPTSLFKGG
jgi:hypothetical protein